MLIQGNCETEYEVEATQFPLNCCKPKTLIEFDLCGIECGTYKIEINQDQQKLYTGKLIIA